MPNAPRIAILWEGYLWKSDKQTKAWKRRYFVLEAICDSSDGFANTASSSSSQKKTNVTQEHASFNNNNFSEKQNPTSYRLCYWKHRLHYVASRLLRQIREEKETTKVIIKEQKHMAKDSTSSSSISADSYYKDVNETGNTFISGPSSNVTSLNATISSTGVQSSPLMNDSNPILVTPESMSTKTATSTVREASNNLVTRASNLLVSLPFLQQSQQSINSSGVGGTNAFGNARKGQQVGQLTSVSKVSASQQKTTRRLYNQVIAEIKRRELETSRRQRMKEHLFKGGEKYAARNIILLDDSATLCRLHFNTKQREGFMLVLTTSAGIWLLRDDMQGNELLVDTSITSSSGSTEEKTGVSETYFRYYVSRLPRSRRRANKTAARYRNPRRDSDDSRYGIPKQRHYRNEKPEKDRRDILMMYNGLQKYEGPLYSAPIWDYIYTYISQRLQNANVWPEEKRLHSFSIPLLSGWLPHPDLQSRGQQRYITSYFRPPPLSRSEREEDSNQHQPNGGVDTMLTSLPSGTKIPSGPSDKSVQAKNVSSTSVQGQMGRQLVGQLGTSTNPIDQTNSSPVVVVQNASSAISNAMASSNPKHRHHHTNSQHHAKQSGIETNPNPNPSNTTTTSSDGLRSIKGRRMWWEEKRQQEPEKSEMSNGQVKKLQLQALEEIMTSPSHQAVVNLSCVLIQGGMALSDSKTLRKKEKEFLKSGQLPSSTKSVKNGGTYHRGPYRNDRFAKHNDGMMMTMIPSSDHSNDNTNNHYQQQTNSGGGTSTSTTGTTAGDVIRRGLSNVSSLFSDTSNSEKHHRFSPRNQNYTNHNTLTSKTTKTKLEDDEEEEVEEQIFHEHWKGYYFVLTSNGTLLKFTGPSMLRLIDTLDVGRCELLHLMNLTH
eukprot:g3637.t1